MAGKLDIYNTALFYCGERKLATLTEARKARHDLDTSWDLGAPRACVEEHDWNFLIKTVESTSDPSIEPEFGWSYAHNEPDDMLKLSGVYTNAATNNPLTQYLYEKENFFTELDTIYLRYIPDTYLDDIESWPTYFANLVSAYMASDIAFSLKNGADQKKIDDKYRQKLRIAKRLDKNFQPTRKLPEGSWISAWRQGRVTGSS